MSKNIQKLVFASAKLFYATAIEVVYPVLQTEPELTWEEIDELLSEVPEHRKSMLESYLLDCPEMAMGRDKSWWKEFSAKLDEACG